MRKLLLNILQYIKVKNGKLFRSKPCNFKVSMILYNTVNYEKIIFGDKRLMWSVL